MLKRVPRGISAGRVDQDWGRAVGLIAPDARELVALVADQPTGFPPGTAWSYSSTGYRLLGLVVEAASGSTLGHELHRRIFGPLGLHGTSFPATSPGIPSPRSRGYSLPLGLQGQPLDGPLLDVTAQNPSWAWAAGALVSDLEDLTCFLRALLGGRLLPPGLLAEMLSTVMVPPGSIPLPLYDRYGLGLLETETPARRVVGSVGGIPGFLNVVLSTSDGRQQLGVMTNVLVAPVVVVEAPSCRWFESSACGSSPREPVERRPRPVCCRLDGPAPAWRRLRGSNPPLGRLAV